VKDTIFYRQAELVLRILPDVLIEEIFALKGGTAINFFFKACLAFPWTLTSLICR